MIENTYLATLVALDEDYDDIYGDECYENQEDSPVDDTKDCAKLAECE